MECYNTSYCVCVCVLVYVLYIVYVCVETNIYVKKHSILKHFQTYAVFSVYVHDHDEVTV